jgi:hypothetical protein
MRYPQTFPPSVSPTPRQCNRTIPYLVRRYPAARNLNVDPACCRASGFSRAWVRSRRPAPCHHHGNDHQAPRDKHGGRASTRKTAPFRLNINSRLQSRGAIRRSMAPYRGRKNRCADHLRAIHWGWRRCFILRSAALPPPVSPPPLIYALSSAGSTVQTLKRRDSAWKMSGAMPEIRRFRQARIALFGSLGVVNLGLDCLIEGTLEVRLPSGRQCEFSLDFGRSCQVTWPPPAP